MNRMRPSTLCAANLLVGLVMLSGCGPVAAGLALSLDSGGDGGAPNSPPVVSIVAPAEGEEVNDRIRMRFRLIDSDADSGRVAVEFSLEGAEFLPATEIPVAGATRSATPEGDEHVFSWNSSLDLGDVERAAIRLRVTPQDIRGARGPSLVSEVFVVRNRRISTFAGGEVFGDVLIQPAGLWLDEAAQTLYIADDIASRVFRLELATLGLERIAGNEFRGSGDNDIPATQGSLNEPTSVLAQGGQLFIGTANRIRALSLSTGFIATLAGTGNKAFAGDGGPPGEADIEDQVFGLSHDQQGNMFFADEHRLRVINGLPSEMTVGGTTIAAGTIESLHPTAGEEPDVWHRVRHAENDGIYVVGAQQVWAFNPGLAPWQVYPASARAITVPPGEMRPIIGAAEGGSSGNFATDFRLQLEERDLVFAAGGGSFFLSTGNHQILRVDRDTGLTEVYAGTGLAENAGDGGPVLSASFRNPRGLALGADGCLFVACSTAVRVINTSSLAVQLGALSVAPGQVETVAAGDIEGFILADDTVAVGPDDSVLTMDATTNQLVRIDASTRTRQTVVGGGGAYAGDGGPAVAASSAGYTAAFDQDGNVYFGSRGRVRVVNLQAVPITVAGKLVVPGFVETIAGNGVEHASGDGGAALSATLVGPENLTLDSQGIIYLSGGARLRAINPRAEVITVAGFEIAPGAIVTLAGDGTPEWSGDGGAPDAARLDPQWLGFDAAENLYIIDAGLPGVRVVNTGDAPLLFYPSGDAVSIAPGTIGTIAGSADPVGAGDGLRALDTQFSDPKSLLVLDGALLICDPGANRLRRVDLASGIISTFTGTGDAGYNGDAIPNVHARVEPDLIAADSRGRLYVLDATGRIRRLFP